MLKPVAYATKVCLPYTEKKLERADRL